MKIPIDLANTISLTNTGLSGPDITQVGADPVWEDNSDATYVDVVRKYAGEAEPSPTSIARVNLAAQSFVADPYDYTYPRMELRIDVRLRGIQSDIPFPFIRLVRAGDGESATPLSTPTMTPTAATNVTLVMSGLLTAWTAPTEHMIEMYQNPLPHPWPGSTGSLSVRNIYVYEVRPYWYVATLGAPPCRITGRGDDLGRGSGRIVPRPKSQQAGRFRGFY